MARVASKCSLHVLNSIYLIISLLLAATALWYFVEIFQVTSMRNVNHYLLDYTVYFPQAIPWMFFVVAMFAVGVACQGFVGTKKGSRRLMVVYVMLQSVLILLFLAAAIIAFVLVDSKANESFIQDTVWDVYVQTKRDHITETAFSNFEKKLQCCGADGPRDYKNWRDSFPMSCCDVYYHGFYGQPILDCSFSNKAPNERYGCAKVATQYASIVTKVLAAVSIFLAFIAIISLAVGVSLAKAFANKPRVISRMHPNETESKKVLL